MNRYLFLFDFDGTLAQTFSPPIVEGKIGLGVNEATEEAVERVLGQEGRDLFIAQGGLRNKSPLETIHDLLAADTTGILARNAENFFHQESQALSGLVPDGKGYPLVWDSNNREQVIAELMVREKLQLLLNQVGIENGQVWPPAFQGVLEFLKTVQAINMQEQGNVKIDLGVVSSGHEVFISRVFDLWRQQEPSIAQPDILVTEDDIRGKEGFPRNLESKVKPGWFPLFLGLRKWRNIVRNEEGNNTLVESSESRRQRVVYIGDDPKKDGGLAERNNFLFGWFNDGNKQATEGDTGNRFIFSDWNRLGHSLQERRRSFVEGRSIREIFPPASATREGKIQGESQGNQMKL